MTRQIILDGLTFEGSARFVNISDGYLDFYNAGYTRDLAGELERHIVKTVAPIGGWPGYTHLITFEDVSGGILVTEKE